MLENLGSGLRLVKNAKAEYKSFCMFYLFILFLWHTKFKSDICTSMQENLGLGLRLVEKC